MTDTNYVDPEKVYPFIHPDETEVVLNGIVGSQPYNVCTFDTEDRLNDYYYNDKFPFSDVEGKNTAPGWSFVARVNETYKGVAGRLILFYAIDSGIESPSQPGQNISYMLEIPIKDPYPENPGASYQLGGDFDYEISLEPADVPAATLALDGVIRENDKNPNQTEPDTQDVSLEAAAEKSAAPAKDDTDAKADATKAALDTSDTNNPVGEATAQTNTDLAAAPTVESDIRNAAPPGSSPEVVAEFEATADEYSSLQTELSTNPPITRIAEITDRLGEISTSLPPSIASASTTITNAVTTLQSPGNIPGFESLVSQATATAGSFLPDASSALGDITNLLDFDIGASLGDLSNLSQTLQSSLSQASGLLSGGNLLDNLPDINELFKFDPQALIKNIDLGQVVNSPALTGIKDLLEDITAGGGLTDVVNQLEAAFGTIGRGFPNNPALADLAGSSDAGFGYNGARSTPSGEQIAQTTNATPEAPEGGPAPESSTPYEKLIEVLEKTLTQDWAVKSGEGDGIKPSEQDGDPRGKSQIPPPPPNTNPLIMEAYRISGQPGLTRDGTSGEYAWHTAFVNWVLSKAGFTIVASMSAQAYYSYGNRVNHTNFNNLRARKGDLVIFNSKTGAKHIGFFWGIDKAAKTVKILGGNQAGTCKLSDFPFSLTTGDFYVTHIRRNWEVPAEVEAAGPEGEPTSKLDGKDGDLSTTPNESAIGPTGAPADSPTDEISMANVTGIAPDPRDRDRDGLPDRASRFGLEDVTSIAPDPNLARTKFNEDGTATLPRDATPAESAAAKAELNKRARKKSDDAFFNPPELSDEEYDAIEIPKRLTPEERKAKDAADRERKKAAAAKRRAQQAKDNEFYGGGAFSTKNGNSQRVVNTTVTESGGGVTETKGGSTSSAVARESAINAAKGSFYRKLSDAQTEASSIKAKYGVTLTPYQPNGSRKWRLR
jgi:hypothetical protein